MQAHIMSSILARVSNDLKNSIQMSTDVCMALWVCVCVCVCMSMEGWENAMHLTTDDCLVIYACVYAYVYADAPAHMYIHTYMICEICFFLCWIFVFPVRVHVYMYADPDAANFHPDVNMLFV